MLPSTPSQASDQMIRGLGRRVGTRDGRLVDDVVVPVGDQAMGGRREGLVQTMRAIFTTAGSGTCLASVTRVLDCV